MHLVDTGLAGHLVGITPERVTPADPGAMTAFGHLLETWVVGEIVKQSGWAETFVTLSHFRSSDGVEVDLVVERDDGRVIGIEVKSAAGAAPRDASGLAFLRDRLGDRFVAGFVLHLGPHRARLGYRIEAAPLHCLWDDRTRRRSAG